MSRFIAAFRSFFAQATDAPYAYGEAAALMALSGIALGRRWLNYGSGIRPNLFMMLAGDSSVARKSTSVVYAKRLLQEVDEIRVGPRDYTVEGLLKWMLEKDPSTQKSKTKVVLFAEEFGADLARMEAYGTTTQADFCALYDGETFEKVRAKAAMIRIDKPRVSLFAAAAYPMLQRHLKPKDWTTGYLMRFLFVAPDQMRPPMVLQPAPPTYAWKQAAIGLRLLRDDLSQHHAALDLDPAAAQYYAQVVTSFQNNVTGGSYIQQTYRARFGVNILKLALLYQLDIDPNQPVGVHAMQLAAAFAANVCWPSFQTAYEKTALNEFEGLFVSVIQALQSPLTRQQLASTFMGNERLTMVVEYLRINSLLTITKVGTTEYLQATVATPSV